MITLQYCDGFCYTLTWISHGGTCVPPSWNPLPPPSPPSLSGSSQSTDFESPASCIDLAPVIYLIYSNIHVLILFSQIIPPSPSPTKKGKLRDVIGIFTQSGVESAIAQLSVYCFLLAVSPMSWGGGEIDILQTGSKSWVRECVHPGNVPFNIWGMCIWCGS